MRQRPRPVPAAATMFTPANMPDHAKKLADALARMKEVQATKEATREQGTQEAR